MKKFILLFMGLVLVLGVTAPCYAQSNSKTIVYYFWSKPRCISCKKIEAYTQEAVNENFSKELQDGSLEFQIIDYSKDKTKQKKYGLFTKSVVLSKIENGKEVRYKNLDKVWTKLNNEGDFKEYIKIEIENFIK